MRNIYFFVVLLSWAALSQAQSPLAADPNLTKLVPPSPNAASLGVYGDIPVSKYTGVPNIEVPLYTLSVGALSLPISLSYHASGIKVAQEASWVGLGWSLNAGGTISRSVVGSDDFDPNKLGYVTNSSYPSCTNGLCDNSNEAGNGDWTEIQQGRKDSGPDQFYYNVGGYAGKMLYVPSKKAFVSLKADNLKIFHDAQGWILTTPNGVRYVFTTEERTTSFQRNESAPLTNAEDITYMPASIMTTSWQLDSIVSPTKEYIYFKYNSASTASASMVYQSQSFRWLYQFYNVPCGDQVGEHTPTNADVHSGQFSSFAYSQSVTQEKYLQQIQGSNGIIISFTTAERQDIKGYSGATPQKLTKVSISSNGIEQTLEHQLSYSYFPSLPHDPAQDYKYLRLRLDAVTTKSNGPYSPVLAKPPYSFTYNNSVLPAKNSFNIDHWGYFNGSDNDNCSSGWSTTSGTKGTLIPTYELVVGNESEGSSGTTPKTRINGANRAPNAATVQNGMLTGITYPTGGSSAFTYEINGFGGAWEDVVKTTTYASLSGSTPLDSSQATIFTKVCPIPIGERIILSAYSYPIPGGSPTNPPFTAYCDNGIKKYSGGNMSSNPLLCFLAPGPGQATGYAFFQYNQWNLRCDADNTTLLKTEVGPSAPNASNNYTLNLQPAPGFLAVATVTTEAIIGRRYVETPAGGVRIKQVVANTGLQTETKIYSYLKPYTAGDPVSELTGSGLLLAPVTYNYTATHAPYSGNGYMDLNFVVNRGALNIEEILVAQSTSCLPMSASAGGNSVGYSQVIETTIDEQGRAVGKTVETYQNATEQLSYPGASYAPYNPFLYPGMPQQPKNDNGLLKSTQIYAADGTMIKAIQHTYELEPDPTSTSRQYITYGSIPYSDCARPLYIKYFDYVSEWWRKTSETTTVYAINHGIKSGLSTLTTYHYDITNKLINEQATSTSTGELLTTKITFAHNNLSETLTPAATLSAMTARYMIGLPIKQETFRGTQRVQATITNYSPQLLPASQQILEGKQLPVRLVYDNYDANGNLTQYHSSYATPTAVLWGYASTKPVITAKNATYTALLTAVSDALGNLGYSRSIADLDLFLRSLGDQTTLAQQQSLKTFTAWVQQHMALRQALVTVYTHHPLFGERSVTDPAGRIITYEYDGLGRLVRTRDEQGRILSQQQYHYAGQ